MLRLINGDLLFEYVSRRCTTCCNYGKSNEWACRECDTGMALNTIANMPTIAFLDEGGESDDK